jgi:hypothetical protein
MADQFTPTGDTGGSTARTARRGRPRRAAIALAAALLSAPLWLVGFGGAVIGNATFGVCTGTQALTGRDVSNGGKCINTDVAGAAIYPYTGYIFLPTGTTAIRDIMAFHVKGAACFTAVSGNYALNLTTASSVSHDYTYTVPAGAGCGYPNPPVTVPSVPLGFTSSGAVVSYTLTVSADTTTYPANINTSRNQVYFYNSQRRRIGQSATNSVKFTRPSTQVSPSPSPVGSPSPATSPSPSSSPVASPSPSSSPADGASPTPVGGNLGVQTTSPTPSGAGAVQPAQNAAGAAGAQGAQGAGLTSPNTGLDPAIPLLLSVFGVFGGLVLLASARKQPRT